MTDLERLLAHDQIRQLAARYAVAVDARDLDALVALFVPDVQVGADRSGRAALRADFDRQLRAIGMSILFVGTHVIDVHDADHATGTVYCKAEVELDGQLVHQAIVYFDDYRRVDGQWRFVRRRHELFYGAPVGTDPLGLEPARWPERAVGLGTRPQAWASWSRFWSDAGASRPVDEAP